MALRPVSTLGLSDATDLTAPSAVETRAVSTVPARGATAEQRAPRRASDRAQRAPQRRARSVSISPSVPALGDEPTSFLQIMVAGELQERLADVSHLLAAEHRKLRHHKTIIGALVWRYVDPDDPQRLRELGDTLDAYLRAELAEVPGEIKIGAHLPFSLKYKLDGASLALRRTRRSASAKTLLSALIWSHVNRDDLADLVALLSAYHEVLQPTPTPLHDLVAHAGSDRVAASTTELVERHATV